MNFIKFYMVYLCWDFRGYLSTYNLFEGYALKIDGASHFPLKFMYRNEYLKQG